MAFTFSFSHLRFLCSNSLFSRILLGLKDKCFLVHKSEKNVVPEIAGFVRDFDCSLVKDGRTLTSCDKCGSVEEIRLTTYKCITIDSQPAETEIERRKLAVVFAILYLLFNRTRGTEKRKKRKGTTIKTQKSNTN